MQFSANILQNYRLSYPAGKFAPLENLDLSRATVCPVVTISIGKYMTFCKATDVTDTTVLDF